jgi:ribonucleoside-diphosphate reductase alpha chain
LFALGAGGGGSPQPRRVYLYGVSPAASRLAIARHVWETRYRLTSGDTPDSRPEDTYARVARAVAAAEPRDADGWGERFREVLTTGKFLPGGRILAGAGSGLRVTLFNCFVLGAIRDSLDGIFAALHEAAVTMQEGGGVGYDFSTLRPRGVSARATGGVASGPVSFMGLWDRMCETLETANNRRGAMMATLRCDHPDIEAFIDAKRAGRTLTNFNLSVQITDALLAAVRADGQHALVFPAEGLGDAAGQASLPITSRPWPGHEGEVPCRVLRTIPARQLWRKLVDGGATSGEPGFLFVDRINRDNNLGYRERITATNPCGEEPLPPYGACNLGSINLAAFVRAPFSAQASLDLAELGSTAALAVRFLDDVVDVSRFPLPAQAEMARQTRRVGLGITGLADALVMLGLRYASPQARELAARAAAVVAHTAYATSAALAAEKGACPAFERDPYLAAPFVAALPAAIRDAIARHGIRNSHLTAIAPAGSISLLAGNVSSGIEPIFRARYRRALRVPGGAEGELQTFEVVDHAVALWEAQAQTAHQSGSGASLPPAFVDAESTPPEAHLDMQIALQPLVDSAISKTIQLPRGYDAEAVSGLAFRAYDGGLKGFTVFPSSSPIGAILMAEPSESCDAPACALPL